MKTMRTLWNEGVKDWKLALRLYLEIAMIAAIAILCLREFSRNQKEAMATQKDKNYAKAAQIKRDLERVGNH